jgi:hypothetical protein
MCSTATVASLGVMVCSRDSFTATSEARSAERLREGGGRFLFAGCCACC